ncbi:regulator of RNase E activity RraA [Rhodococcus rhodochrous J38]|uniref:RraA family protein n=1 Tax=Rhodococcus rhodochrous TaxID=1829 RepID=UPI0011AAE526|nr:RraA family protein [Rhodococcus rhodochrous]TWH41960.1 regulator of RNase E activity RraA [Rhodococcus rhodochrous J38]
MNAKYTSEIRQRYLAVDTANVADVLDTLGLTNQGLAAEFAAVSGTRLAGWAYTIAGQMQPYEGGGDPKKMEACNGIGPDEISVWSGNGEGICYFGELIAVGMKEKGSVGALVDGGVRDVRWLNEHDIPVFARYRTSVQSIGRWLVTSYQEPVSLRGATSTWVTVNPGDFIVADEDGAVVIPQDYVERVLEESERLTATEVKIREALAAGDSLSECLAKFGHV